MKVSDYVALRLHWWGLDTCFAVTGGGAMHLNDSFGSIEGISVRYMHHEQACAIAAEGYARIAGRPAIVNVTSGPGSLNALNGVFGAFTDSIPMVVVAGQVRRDTDASARGLDTLRQLGDQEAPMLDVISRMTVWRGSITDPERIQEAVDAAVMATISGRPGPAWLEIAVDVQAMQVDLDPLAPLPRAEPRPRADLASPVAQILAMVRTARRPLILAGSGVRSSGTQDLLPRLADALGAPVATAWTHDVIPSDHPAFAGRPGTIGTRAGNFVLQSCDVLLVLGSRLNIRQVSYNWDSFAAEAKIIWVDVDPAELKKPYLSPDLALVADLRDLLPVLVEEAEKGPETRNDEWWSWCQDIRARFEPHDDDYPVRPEGINAYHLIAELSRQVGGNHVIACGDATACIVPFQCLSIQPGLRMFSNSGSASMGYDLPAALGAAAAAPDRRVISIAGDGSVMMNLQELQTLRAWDADVLLIVLDNGGYLSIKQTQSNFFGREYGASPASGVTFPDFAAVACAFGLPTVVLDPTGPWRDQLQQLVDAKGPRVCVAPLDQHQEFEPRLRSRLVDGVIRTPPLDDMFPHLEDDVLDAVRLSGRRL